MLALCLRLANILPNRAPCPHLPPKLDVWCLLAVHHLLVACSFGSCLLLVPLSGDGSTAAGQQPVHYGECQSWHGPPLQRCIKGAQVPAGRGADGQPVPQCFCISSAVCSNTINDTSGFRHSSGDEQTFSGQPHPRTTPLLRAYENESDYGKELYRLTQLLYAPGHTTALPSHPSLGAGVPLLAHGQSNCSGCSICRCWWQPSLG